MYKAKAEWKFQSVNLLIHPFSLQALTLRKEPDTPLIYSVWVESMLTGLDFLISGNHKYCRHVEAIRYFDC